MSGCGCHDATNDLEFNLESLNWEHYFIWLSCKWKTAADKRGHYQAQRFGTTAGESCRADYLAASTPSHSASVTTVGGLHWPATANRTGLLTSLPLKSGGREPLGEFGLQPYNLGESSPGHVFCFWKPIAAKEMESEYSLPMASPSWQDWAHTMIHSSSCLWTSLQRNSVQKGRKLDQKALTDLLRGARLWLPPQRNEPVSAADFFHGIM